MEIIVQPSTFIDHDRKLPMLPPHKVKVAVSILAETVNYNHRMMNIPAMWELTKGIGIKIAILDTGLPKHVDLEPTGGKSFVPKYLTDLSGHSTHVGGIIAATAFNGMGVRGIAPDVEHWYGTVLDAQGTGSINMIIDGIHWAVDEVGVDIINMSLGLPAGISRVKALEDACNYAASKGVTLFAAAGNEGGAVGQPAVYDSVTAIAAVDSDMRVPKFSNRGKAVKFAAGGVDVFSTYLNDTYAMLSGTSMACPAISAVSALILSDALYGKDPRKLTTEELLGKLKKICYDVGNDGYDKFTGYGIPMFFNSNTGDVVPAKPGCLTIMMNRIKDWLGVKCL